MPEEKPISSFLDVMTELRQGKAMIDLSERLTEVVTAVQNTGKAGKVSIEITVRPAHKGELIDQFFLSDTIKHTVPEKDRPDTLFMVNHEGVLTSFSSRQQQLELRVVEAEFRNELKDLKEVE